MKTTKTNCSRALCQLYPVLLVAMLVLALSPIYAEQVTSGVAFAQVSFTASNPPEKYSHYGQVSVDYTTLYGDGYVNVEKYDNGKAAGWVVRNLPVVNGSALSGFSTMFDLGASGYQSSLAAYVDYSTTPLADDTSLTNQAPLTYQMGQAEYPLSAPAPPPGKCPSGGTVCFISCPGNLKGVQAFPIPNDYKSGDPINITIKDDGNKYVCFTNNANFLIKSAVLEAPDNKGKITFKPVPADIFNAVPKTKGITDITFNKGAGSGIPQGKADMLIITSFVKDINVTVKFFDKEQ